MKHITEIYPTTAVCPSFLAATDKRRPVLFDIETTGLSASRSFVYLIGTLTLESNSFTLRQWFSESPDEEIDVLQAFSESLSPEDKLVHYNGNTFDLPFLEERFRHYGLTSALPPKEDTLDLFRSLSFAKGLFRLCDRKQRTLEPIAGYHRSDPYDGGTLIGFYSEYVGKVRFDEVHAEELLFSLLRHNREDLLGLSALTDLYAVASLLSGNIVHCEPVSSDETSLCLNITLREAIPTPLALSLPLPISEEVCPAPAIHLSAMNCTAELHVPVLHMSAKHYFANYKDYYYLPLEERVVHRSIASHMERSYRIPATKETACTIVTGAYLPQWEPLFLPEFRTSLKDRLSFFPSEELTRKPDLLPRYTVQLLRNIYPKK